MDGWVKIGTELDTKNFDAQIDQVKAQMEEIEHKLKQADMGFEVGDTVKLEAQYEKLNSKLGSLVQKQQELNKQDLSNISKSIDNVSDKTGKAIKKVGKWALAIFGVRSAYLGIRRAISTISQYNDQIKTDLEYMGYALAMTLEPIIQAIIKGVYTLLQYVNYVAMAWFGVNLFAKSGVDKFKGMNKEAKELKKTLTGFDEMNILNDSGGAGGNMTPSIDLSKINEDSGKFKSFWDNIFKFWEKDWENWFLKTEGNWSLFVKGLGYTLKGFYDVFKGVFDVLGGIVEIFIGIFKGDVEKMQNGWQRMCDGFVSLLTGAFTLIVGVVSMAVGIIKGILLTLLMGVYNEVIKPVGKLFADLWNGIVNGAITSWNGVKTVFSAVGSFFKGIFDTVKNTFKNIGQTVGNIVASAFKTAINAVLSLADTIINSPIKAINKLTDTINKVPGINLGKLNKIKIPRLATGGIINYPNKGVSLGGAIGGERGAEGVIPLTDSQAMETLGQAIGKYITINANIPINMNGRVISREVKKIYTDDDFVMNR